MTNSRFNAVYKIYDNSKSALEKAKTICFEQTVELDDEAVTDPFIRENITGKISEFKKINDFEYQAVISYPAETSSYEITQLLNLLFGNTSLKKEIKLVDFIPDENLLKTFKGPAFGIEGIRKITGIHDKPLICAALKPMGKNAKELADTAFAFASGGADIIKDDHGLTNQSFCRFEERVSSCAEAVSRANEKTGHKAIYVPNITAPFDRIIARAEYAKANGAGGLLIAPGLTGFDTMRYIAHDSGLNLPVFSHPALLGCYTSCSQSGMSHSLLYAKLQRLAGADASIYPNYGGRFGFTKDECMSITDACREISESLKPVFPMPGGGMKKNNIQKMILDYGNDVIYLLGGSLYTESADLTANVKTFLALIGR